MLWLKYTKSGRSLTRVHCSGVSFWKLVRTFSRIGVVFQICAWQFMQVLVGGMLANADSSTVVGQDRHEIGVRSAGEPHPRGHHPNRPAEAHDHEPGGRVAVARIRHGHGKRVLAPPFDAGKQARGSYAATARASAQHLYSALVGSYRP